MAGVRDRGATVVARHRREWHARAMGLLGIGRRTREQDVPVAVLDELRRRHPGLSPVDAERVGEGLQQWREVARLAGRDAVVQPSALVAELAALAGDPDPRPVSEADRGLALRRTWELARRVPGPLFVLDHELGAEGAVRYVATCGTANTCHAGDAVCVEHLPSAPVSLPRAHRWAQGDRTFSDQPPAHRTTQFPVS